MKIIENEILSNFNGGTRLCDALAGFGLGVALWGSLETGGAAAVALGVAGVGCTLGWW
jgi:hypothetical protein